MSDHSDEKKTRLRTMAGDVEVAMADMNSAPVREAWSRWSRPSVRVVRVQLRHASLRLCKRLAELLHGFSFGARAHAAAQTPARATR